MPGRYDWPEMEGAEQWHYDWADSVYNWSVAFLALHPGRVTGPYQVPTIMPPGQNYSHWLAEETGREWEDWMTSGISFHDPDRRWRTAVEVMDDGISVRFSAPSFLSRSLTWSLPRQQGSLPRQQGFDVHPAFIAGFIRTLNENGKWYYVPKPCITTELIPGGTDARPI